MAILKPKVSPDDVLLDRCFADPELDEALAVVGDTRRPAEERVARAVPVVTGRRGDPERQTLAVDVLAAALQDVADAVAEAARASEGPDRGDVAALAAAAVTDAAWEVRGHGMAETVSEPSGRTFLQMLEDADELAHEGLQAVPGHPGCASVRVTTARGRGLPVDEIVHRFGTAREVEPLLFPAHMQMLQTVCEKWYGSHEAMFDLVRQTLEVTPAGHPTTAVLPIAHLEVHGAGHPEADGRRKADREHMAGLSDPLLAGDDRHPRALEAHSAFGWFFAAVDDDRRARLHLERTGHRPSWLWNYLGEDARVPYAAVLRQVGLSR